MVFSEFASAPFEPQASLPENFLKKNRLKAELLMLWEFLAMKRTLEIAPCARILRLHTHGKFHHTRPC